MGLIAGVGLLLAWVVWVLVGLFKLALWLVAASLFGVWWCQGQMLYMPTYPDRKGERRKLVHNMRGYRDPSEQQLPFEDVYIPAQDGCKVHCWLVAQENKSLCPTIIFFHGNAGNIGFRIPNARQLFALTGCNILLVDYRGFGNSDNHEPTERGLNLDAQAVLDWTLARKDLDPKKIFLYGSSLGGAVSISLAARNQDKICGLIIENTFTSIDDMVVTFARRLRVTRGETLIRIFMHFYLTNHWPNLKLVKQLRLPILYMSGLEDELIPPEQMQQLYDASSASRHRQLHTVPRGHHNDTFNIDPPLFYETFSEFVSRHV